MKISEYYEEFTDKKRFGFRQILEESLELVGSLFTFSRGRIKDEIGDVSVFIQLWLYCRFDHDARLWRTTEINLRKVRQRKVVWERIYKAAGLPKQRSVYCANYRKEERVIRHLGELGIKEDAARRAYQEVVAR